MPMNARKRKDALYESGPPCQAVRMWLKRKVALKVLQHLLASLLYALVGLCVLCFTFFFTYAVVWFGFNYGVSAFSQLVFNKELRLSHHQILCVSGLFMA